MPLRNAPSALSGTYRALRERFKQPPDNPQREREEVLELRHRLEQSWAILCAQQRAAGLVPMGKLHWLTVNARPKRWQDTGLTVQTGDIVSLIPYGQAAVYRWLRLSLKPRAGLWFKVGEAPIARLPGDCVTLRMTHQGPLRCHLMQPGGFATQQGTLDRLQALLPLSGAFEVAVIHWRADPTRALTDLAALDAVIWAPVLKQYTRPRLPPADWRYLWLLGQGDVFEQVVTEQGPQVNCLTQGEVAILQYPGRWPLHAQTQLQWSWFIQQLPSQLPEHVQLTHDYLSIAVEFDNGLDLTYMWSAGLPEGTVFQCPLPYWNKRETHWVVRSGTDHLRQWCHESRAVFNDYQVAIGGPMPTHIVAVWLIANSSFQQQVGECAYRDIAVTDSKTRSVCLPAIAYTEPLTDNTAT